jgi:NADH:ubiquinone oxidoreductase subunit
MTVDEVYSKIASHMIKGIMFHEELANYYDFLGLKGYKRCHEYHFIDETCAYRGLCRYYINHHNKLIPHEEVEEPDVIPESWYKYTRQEVDNNTKKNAVKNGMTLWVNWEKETKQLYEQMYKELIEIGEVASAMKIKELVCDVDCELKKAERYQLNKKAVDYDLDVVIEEQNRKHDKYRKKMKRLGVEIC